MSGSSEPVAASPDGHGLRIGVVASRFNTDIVERLVETAQEEFGRLGVLPLDVIVVRVPGAFELPLAAQALLRSAAPPDAVVCLGAVVRGETPHFDFVAGAAADGILRVGLSVGRPVIFGVLTTDTVAQAWDRADGTYRRGADAARDAVEMGRLLTSLDVASAPVGSGDADRPDTRALDQE